MPRPRQNQERKLTRAEIQKAYRQRQAEARAQEREQKGLPAAPAIPTMPGTARWNALLQNALAALDTCRSEMQAYFDDRSEAWQESEKADQMQRKIDALDAIAADLEEVTSEP